MSSYLLAEGMLEAIPSQKCHVMVAQFLTAAELTVFEIQNNFQQTCCQGSLKTKKPGCMVSVIIFQNGDFVFECTIDLFDLRM